MAMLWEDYDDYYCGLWFDRDDYRPFFAMTFVSEEMQSTADKAGVTLLVMKYSYKQLEEIVDYVPVSLDSRIYGAGVDESSNKAVIYVDENYAHIAVKIIRSHECLSKYLDAISIKLSKEQFFPY